MRILQRSILAMAVLVIAVGTVRASHMDARAEPQQYKKGPSATAAAMAATLNVVYIPVRLGFTIVGSWLAGITGFLTAGDEDAALAVGDALCGSASITPGMLEGEERIEF